MELDLSAAFNMFLRLSRTDNGMPFRITLASLPSRMRQEW